MKKYIQPLYEKESFEAEDIILTSLQVSEQEVTVGNVTGKKVMFQAAFEDLWNQITN